MNDILQIHPEDEYNRRLISNVHPAQWKNPEPIGCYNLVVVGAGSAGLVTAAGAAGLGARVALVERHLMGGDCLSYGCVPSKCLIRSAQAAADARDIEKFGVKISGPVEVDFPAVMARMRRLRSELSHNDSVERFANELGIDVFLGQGRFTGSRTLQVAGKSLRFKKAVIATGARAFQLPIEGLAEAGFLTNESVFSLDDRPERMAVIGSGPLGCELAQAFARLGCQVTVLEKGPQILPREDRDAAQLVEKAMLEDGIEFVFDCRIIRVSTSGGEKKIELECQAKQQELLVDEILVGVGRVPNVDGLGLETAGVTYDKRKGVLVNDRLQTSNRRVFAAGDICLAYKFTHTADATARMVIQNALFWGRKKLSALTIPWCTYTDPEVAHVGMYEKQAIEKGIPVETFSVSLGDVDRAIADGEEKGLVKIHVKKGTDKILGATIVARHAGEMISEISVAMHAKMGLGAISAVIHPYPTQAEAIRKVADTYNRTRLTPRVKRLFDRLFSFLRGGKNR
ncbi:MAG: mercuric reductase [Deltaproteobacteria bacterium]|nr:mercuric reductase [Deltaproteobacteria bacterium]